MSRAQNLSSPEYTSHGTEISVYKIKIKGKVVPAHNMPS
jgi:hypothetical protein